MMIVVRLFVTNVLLAVHFLCCAQQGDSTCKDLPGIADNYYAKVDAKLSSTDQKLTNKSIKYLQKLQRQEEKLKNKLQELHNPEAATLFAGSKEKYAEFITHLKSRSNNISKTGNAPYDPYVDSLGTSLAFLKELSKAEAKVEAPLNSLQHLQVKLQQAEEIKQYILQRKEQVKQVLSAYTKLPAALQKQYARLNKTAYYYSAEVQEYKAMLKNPLKAEQKVMKLLRKLPAFKKFMQQNNQLALLFGVPENYATQQGPANLQTRSSVEGLLQARIASGGPGAQQVIQQNITGAQSELTKLKDQLNHFADGSGAGIDMPDFKPNNQKTKSLWKRLEYGANLQLQKSNSLFPSTTNAGLSLGYKLNDKSIIGIGMSYEIGMGTLRRIVISHQGIGLRSFADYKIKKSFFVSGGYEINHFSSFKKIEELKNFNDWQSSGLLGVSKRYSVNKKVKGEMKLLYDFLANAHKPATQPIVFRVGYKL